MHTFNMSPGQHSMLHHKLCILSGPPKHQTSRLEVVANDEVEFAYNHLCFYPTNRGLTLVIGILMDVKSHGHSG